MSVPEQSLITDEHRATIGRKSDPVKVVITREDAHRMRDVLGDKDPRYADETGMAPPYVIAGMGGGPRRGMPQILPGGLLTQQEWKFTRPFKIGEELTLRGLTPQRGGVWHSAQVRQLLLMAKIGAT